MRVCVCWVRRGAGPEGGGQGVLDGVRRVRFSRGHPRPPPSPSPRTTARGPCASVFMCVHLCGCVAPVAPAALRAVLQPAELCVCVSTAVIAPPPPPRCRPVLVEGLTELALNHPDDPLLWLSQYLLDRSPSGSSFKIVPVRWGVPPAAMCHLSCTGAVARHGSTRTP
jgi:hypothetical protein